MRLLLVDPYEYLLVFSSNFLQLGFPSLKEGTGAIIPPLLMVGPMVAFYLSTKVHR